MGTEIYVASDKKLPKSAPHTARLKALKKTAYKFTKLPEAPNLYRVKCQKCQPPEVSAKSKPQKISDQAAPSSTTLHTKEIMDTSSPSSTNPIEEKEASGLSCQCPLSRNQQYQKLNHDSLFPEQCIALLSTLAQENKVHQYYIYTYLDGPNSKCSWCTVHCSAHCRPTV